ncbi:DUF2834 domain-containing protein [Gordonia aurantiaca]|uniref:DUF2834 domain-containing protein n=1 Tax=Gordonia sp. B21 TaxID=3151852 RepID=UPI0032649473
MAAPHQKWRERSLFAVFVTALISQNAIAIPYVQRNGPSSAKDFFVGDIMKTTPGRFAMVDLLFVVIGFHLWAYGEARRLRIIGWWWATLVLTFGVGIGTAIPFFFYARERAQRS